MSKISETPRIEKISVGNQNQMINSWKQDSQRSIYDLSAKSVEENNNMLSAYYLKCVTTEGNKDSEKAEVLKVRPILAFIYEMLGNELDVEENYTTGDFFGVTLPEGANYAMYIACALYHALGQEELITDECLEDLTFTDEEKENTLKYIHKYTKPEISYEAFLEETKKEKVLGKIVLMALENFTIKRTEKFTIKFNQMRQNLPKFGVSAVPSATQEQLAMYKDIGYLATALGRRLFLRSPFNLTPSAKEYGEPLPIDFDFNQEGAFKEYNSKQSKIKPQEYSQFDIISAPTQHLTYFMVSKDEKNANYKMNTMTFKVSESDKSKLYKFRTASDVDENSDDKLNNPDLICITLKKVSGKEMTYTKTHISDYQAYIPSMQGLNVAIPEDIINEQYKLLYSDQEFKQFYQIANETNIGDLTGVLREYFVSNDYDNILTDTDKETYGQRIKDLLELEVSTEDTDNKEVTLQDVLSQQISTPDSNGITIPTVNSDTSSTEANDNQSLTPEDALAKLMGSTPIATNV